jgi:hypothetical protein
MARVVYFALLVLSVACLLPAEALARDETTSAIVGEVRDANYPETETNVSKPCDFDTRPFPQTRPPVSIAYSRPCSGGSDTPSHRASTFSLFKRGLTGSFHKVSLNHLQR